MSSERTRTDRILESYGYDQSNLIAILQEIQAEYKYLSEESLTLVAEKLGISAAKVYSVATFFPGSQGKAHHQGLCRHRLSRP